MRSTPSSLRPSSRRREVEEPKGARLSANAKILRELIRARQQLLKIEVRIFRRDYLPILRRMEQELLEAVAEIESGRPLNEISEKRVRELLRQFSAIIKNAEDSLRDAVGQGVADVAKREVKLQRATVKKIALGVEFNAVPAEQLAAVIDSTTEDLLHPFVKNWGKATLDKAKEEIAIAVGLGEDMDEAADRIAAAISSSKKQALTIARTGIQQAAATAAEAFHEANADIEKGVEYVATLDLRTCPICGPDDGKYYSHEPDPKADGLFSEKPELVRHPNCFPSGVVVSGPRALLATSRRFEGDLVVIRRAGCKDLAATENHPILTRRGWVAAGLIREGDELVDGVAAQWAVRVAVAPHDRQVEAAIQELARARGISSLRVPVAAPDFHGDGIGTVDHRVDVEILDGALRSECDVSLGQSGVQRQLARRRLVALSRTTHGARMKLADRDFATAHSIVCPLRPRAPLVRRSHSHAVEHRIRAVSWLDSHSEQAHADRDARDAEVLCQRLLRLTAQIPGTKVVEIDRVAFAGHVFNLQTSMGWYVANGCIVSNCRCTYVPVLKSWRDLGIDIDDAEVASTRASMDGQVPDTLTWEDWLEERPENEQKAILGKGVFALWKDGKISTADLKRGNARRTLAQLLNIAEK